MIAAINKAVTKFMRSAVKCISKQNLVKSAKSNIYQYCYCCQNCGYIWGEENMTCNECPACGSTNFSIQRVAA